MSLNNNVQDKTYIPLSPFKGWVLENFPFIEADFDAITNYQLLCKVTEYLNNVINNQNQVQELGTELVTAYNQLLDYVNNYFDNLDVQEEINNKLNEMVEDGTMERLLSSVTVQYVNPLIDEQNAEISSFKNSVNSQISGLTTRVDSIASGNPIPVSSTSDMTNTSRTYLLTTDGYWYYYNGTAWTRGDVYQATELSDNSVTPEMTTFIDKEVSQNLFNPATVSTGNVYSSSVSIGSQPTLSPTSGFSCNLVPIKPNTAYIVSGVSYDITYYNADKEYLGQSTISSSTANRIIPADHNHQDARYIGLSYRHNTFPTATYMVVEGTEMPQDYVPYFAPYYKLDDIKIDSDDIIDYQEETYYVGENRSITSFISLINAISDNDNPKTIYIDGGIYDIFEEMGGSEYALSIEQGSTWSQVNPIIPDNTKIIGLGNVIFNFLPEPEEIGTIADTLLSPINVIGNIEIHNLTINAKNCRYAIHDDGSSDRDKDYSRHIYKNVIANKTGNGFQQAFGGGIGNGCYFEFDDCEFYSGVAPCFSFHNQWYARDGQIVLNNCIIKNQNQAIRLGSLSVSHPDNPILVNINSTYINGPIKLSNEDGNPERENPYKIRMLKSSNVTIDTSVFPDNPFTPEIYN